MTFYIYIKYIIYDIFGIVVKSTCWSQPTKKKKSEKTYFKQLLNILNLIPDKIFAYTHF